MKMKRIGTLIISTALAASVIAGCSQQISETTASVPGTEATTVATASTSAAASSGETTEPQGPQSFEELYATQLTNYLDHQYYFDGKAIPKTESNFYFINSFLDLSGYASMGYYPSTNLQYIDLAAEYPGDEYDTYGDYFVMYSENSIESTCILCARAEEEGVKLSDETMTALDDMMNTFKTGSAANSGMSLDEYLQFYYGPGMDEANFRYALERYYLADAYSEVYCGNYPFTNEEKNVPYVRYALFYAPETADQSAKDQALSAATIMKDACKSIDDLTGLASAAQETGAVYDQGDIAVPKGQMVAKFEEWAYGEGRTEGELDIIYAPEYGYFVVGYLGLQERSKDSLDQIALQALSLSVLDEIKEKKHDFHTDDPYLPAPAGPTATPVPGETESTQPASDEVVFNPNATTQAADTTSTSSGTVSNTTDVIIIVFFTLAGVAIAAVIFILIMSAVKNSKNNNGKNNSGKPAKKSFDRDDDGKPAASGKNKKSKAAEPEEEEAEPEDNEADSELVETESEEDKESDESPMDEEDEE